MLPAAHPPALHARLDALRTGLIDLAFTLDARGAHAAADVAMTTAAQIAELCAEAPPLPLPSSGPPPSKSPRNRRRPPTPVSRT